jgi:electron transfer flavoprotein alpha subunit
MSDQAATDAAIAAAQTAIDAARAVCAQHGRIALRQLATMLDGEVYETRAQLQRSYQPKSQEDQR